MQCGVTPETHYPSRRIQSPCRSRSAGANRADLPARVARGTQRWGSVVRLL